MKSIKRLIYLNLLFLFLNTSLSLYRIYDYTFNGVFSPSLFITPLAILVNIYVDQSIRCRGRMVKWSWYDKFAINIFNNKYGFISPYLFYLLIPLSFVEKTLNKIRN